MQHQHSRTRTRPSGRADWKWGAIGTNVPETFASIPAPCRRQIVSLGLLTSPTVSRLMICGAVVLSTLWTAGCAVLLEHNVDPTDPVPVARIVKSIRCELITY